MANRFEQFCEEARTVLRENPGPDGRDVVRGKLETLLRDDAFIAEQCGPDAAPGIRTIYRDPEMGFNVLVHVYEKGKAGPPHDHGKSWAIYGQVAGSTIMTVWKRLDDGAKDGKADIEKDRSFRLEPGMAGKFDVGQIHSIEISDGSKFVRVTGTDLSKIDTAVFNPDAHTVAPGNRL